MGIAVSFEGVSKRYRGAAGPNYASVRDDVVRAISGVTSIARRRPSPESTIVALDEVSFEVKAGDSYALVGTNGAGKTTALKIISRITYPTSGRARVNGRVGALLEVGAGIHPELSGRENIWFHGQILGMSRTDVRRQFDAIVDFSELEHMLEVPVKMYSTGMQMRLGFAIASHLNPEVFLVDEALAVGDAGFQAKCVDRMSKLVAEGRTLLFVSHNLSAVEALCRNAVLLSGGRVEAEGPAKQVVKIYLDSIDAALQKRSASTATLRGSRYLDVESVTCHGSDGVERYAFATGEDLVVSMRVRAKTPISAPYFSIGITDGRAGAPLILASMLADGGAPDEVDGEAEMRCRLRRLPLLPGVYQLWGSVRGEHAFGDLFDWQQIGSFRIADGAHGGGPLPHHGRALVGPVYVPHEWTVEHAVGRMQAESALG